MKMLQRLAFCVAGLGVWIAAPAMAADTVIKVGLIMTLSGPSASLGENISRGAELYFKQRAGLPHARRPERRRPPRYRGGELQCFTRQRLLERNCRRGNYHRTHLLRDFRS